MPVWCAPVASNCMGNPQPARVKPVVTKGEEIAENITRGPANARPDGKGAARLKRSGASRTAGMRAYAPVRQIFHASYLRCPAAEAMSGAARRAPGRTILNGVIQGDVNTIPSSKKRVPTPRTLMRQSCGGLIPPRRQRVLSRRRAGFADDFSVCHAMTRQRPSVARQDWKARFLQRFLTRRLRPGCVQPRRAQTAKLLSACYAGPIVISLLSTLTLPRNLLWK